MYNVSNKYKNAIISNVKQKNYVKGAIFNNNGEKVFDITDNIIIPGSLFIDKRATDNHFGVGCVNIGQLSISLKLKNTFLFDNCYIDLTYYYDFDDNTTEIIPLGRFYISQVTENKGVVTLKAYDAMYKFDEDVSASINGTPFSIATSICNHIGIALGNTSTEIESMPNGKVVLSLDKDDYTTYRSVLSELASILGKYCFIGRDNKLYFRSFGTTATTHITSSNATDTEFENWDASVKWVVGAFHINNDNKTKSFTELSYGTGMTVNIGTIKLFKGSESDCRNIITNIANSLNNLNYKVCNIKSISDPSIDVGDMFSFQETFKSQTRISNGLLTHYTWNYHKEQVLYSEAMTEQESKVQNSEALLPDSKGGDTYDVFDVVDSPVIDYSDGAVTVEFRLDNKTTEKLDLYDRWLLFDKNLTTNGTKLNVTNEYEIKIDNKYSVDRKYIFKEIDNNNFKVATTVNTADKMLYIDDIKLKQNIIGYSLFLPIGKYIPYVTPEYLFKRINAFGIYEARITDITFNFPTEFIFSKSPHEEEQWNFAAENEARITPLFPGSDFIATPVRKTTDGSYNLSSYFSVNEPSLPVSYNSRHWDSVTNVNEYEKLFKPVQILSEVETPSYNRLKLTASNWSGFGLPHYLADLFVLSVKYANMNRNFSSTDYSTLPRNLYVQTLKMAEFLAGFMACIDVKLKITTLRDYKLEDREDWNIDAPDSEGVSITDKKYLGEYVDEEITTSLYSLYKALKIDYTTSESIYHNTYKDITPFPIELYFGSSIETFWLQPADVFSKIPYNYALNLRSILYYLTQHIHLKYKNVYQTITYSTKNGDNGLNKADKASGDLKSKVASLDGRVSALEGRMDIAETDIKNLKREVGITNNNVAKNTEDINSLNGEVTDLDERVTTLEQKPETSVIVDSLQLSGKHIADITVNGEKTELYAPSGGSGGGTDVGWQQLTTEGTHIANIILDDETIPVYSGTSEYTDASGIARFYTSHTGTSGYKVKYNVNVAIPFEEVQDLTHNNDFCEVVELSKIAEPYTGQKSYALKILKDGYYNLTMQGYLSNYINNYWCYTSFRILNNDTALDGKDLGLRALVGVSTVELYNSTNVYLKKNDLVIFRYYSNYSSDNRYIQNTYFSVAKINGVSTGGSGGSGGSEVSYEQTLTEGTKIGDITIDGKKTDIYAPTQTTVNVTPLQSSGKHIADIEINGEKTELYAPNGGSGGGSNVEVVTKQTTGTNIADIKVDDTTYRLFAPNSGGGSGVIKPEPLKKIQNCYIYVQTNNTYFNIIGTTGDNTELAVFDVSNYVGCDYEFSALSKYWYNSDDATGPNKMRFAFVDDIIFNPEMEIASDTDIQVTKEHGCFVGVLTSREMTSPWNVGNIKVPAYGGSYGIYQNWGNTVSGIIPEGSKYFLAYISNQMNNEKVRNGLVYDFRIFS